MSVQQLRLLQKYSRHLIFVPDQDQAGISNFINNAMLAIQHNFTVSFIKALPAKDIADTIQQLANKQEANNYLQQTYNYFDFLLYYFSKNLDQNDHNSILQFLNQTLDKLVVYNLQDLTLNAYLQTLANKSNIELATIKATFISKKKLFTDNALLEQKLQKPVNKALSSAHSLQHNYFATFDKNNCFHLLILQAIYSRQTFLTIQNFSRLQDYLQITLKSPYKMLLKTLEKFYLLTDINENPITSI